MCCIIALVRFWLSFALNDYIHGLFSDCISGKKKKRELLLEAKLFC